MSNISRHVIKMFVPLALSLTLLGCAVNGVVLPPGSLEGTYPYTGYEPIDPISTPDIYVYEKAGTGNYKLWAEMEPDTVRKFLPNQTSTTTIKKISSDGKISYLTASASAEAGIYEVIMDYAKYRTELIYEDSGTPISGGKPSNIDQAILGYGKIGVGVRIRASVQTLKSGVDLNGLFALGVAARAQSLRGTISVDVIGIDSLGVNALLPVGVQLDESSIQSSLQSLATIQTKIYDKEVRLTPHLIAIRRGLAITGNAPEIKDAVRSKIINKFQQPQNMQPMQNR